MAVAQRHLMTLSEDTKNVNSHSIVRAGDEKKF